MYLILTYKIISFMVSLEVPFTIPGLVEADQTILLPGNSSSHFFSRQQINIVISHFYIFDLISKLARGCWPEILNWCGDSDRQKLMLIQWFIASQIVPIILDRRHSDRITHNIYKHPSVQTLIIAFVSCMLVIVVSEGVCPPCPQCLARVDLTHTFVTFPRRSPLSIIFIHLLFSVLYF